MMFVFHIQDVCEGGCLYNKNIGFIIKAQIVSLSNPTFFLINKGQIMSN